MYNRLAISKGCEPQLLDLLFLLVNRFLTMEGILGKWMIGQVMKSVEDVALLSLAFCNSHQLAAQDLAQYEKLERWDVDHPESKLFREGEEIRLIKQGVTEQVGFHIKPSATAILEC